MPEAACTIYVEIVPPFEFERLDRPAEFAVHRIVEPRPRLGVCVLLRVLKFMHEDVEECGHSFAVTKSVSCAATRSETLLNDASRSAVSCAATQSTWPAPLPECPASR